MITVTEALAEIKTIGKRLNKKRDNVMRHVCFPDVMKDPLENEEGSTEFVRKERQGISDLEHRIIKIRCAIQRSNLDNTLVICGAEYTVAEWLNWRREIATNVGALLDQINQAIDAARKKFGGKTDGADGKEISIQVNVSESELATEIERHQEILGTLDGRLSLYNATTNIEV